MEPKPQDLFKTHVETIMNHSTSDCNYHHNTKEGKRKYICVLSRAWRICVALEPSMLGGTAELDMRRLLFCTLVLLLCSRSRRYAGTAPGFTLLHIVQDHYPHLWKNRVQQHTHHTQTSGLHGATSRKDPTFRTPARDPKQYVFQLLGSCAREMLAQYL